MAELSRAFELTGVAIEPSTSKYTIPVGKLTTADIDRLYRRLMTIGGPKRWTNTHSATLRASGSAIASRALEEVNLSADY